MIKEFLEKDENISNWSELLQSFVNTFKRAYSIIIVTDTDKVYLLKDGYGVRPLCYSYSESNQTLEVASESVGISLKEHDKITEVNPGEILEFDLANINVPKIIYNLNTEKGIEQLYGGKCIFEYIYFLNSKTTWNNLPVEKIRNEWAKSLAKTDLEWINSVDKSDYIVIGIPSTGVQPGKSYAEELDLTYIQGITKDSKVNRTFILAESERDKVSKKKYIYNKEIIEGKRVIIIDDSIVRGITMRNLVHSIFDNGALDVHIRIISPTITDICKYGIDIPTKEELIANKMSITEMNDYFGTSSLKFLEIDLLMKTIDPYIKKNTICSGCFGGTYNDVDIEDLVVNKPTTTYSHSLGSELVDSPIIESSCILS
jgi:amidophosphoribosyltransferase